MKIHYLLLILLILSSVAHSKIIEVGPSKVYTKPSLAASVVSDGDTIYIDSGLYDGDGAIWNKNNLLITGVGGYAHLKAGTNLPQGKSIWIIKGNDTRIENIEFSDAKVPDKNGAGIRMEGKNLTIRKCYFHDNEDGILAGDNANSTIIIEKSIFAYNGYGDGYSHNLYINHVKNLYFRFNYSHHAKVGHCLKTRAYNNYIEYNFLSDSTDGNSSFLIDMPNGGNSYVIGNILFQGPKAENNKMLNYGVEGYTNPEKNLYVVNNTFVNQRATCQFINIASGNSDTRIVNNAFCGIGALGTGAINGKADTITNVYNVNPDKMGFVDYFNYNFKLTEFSNLVDAGTVPSFPTNYPLNIRSEYKHPADSAITFTDQKPDIGAYQFKKTTGITESINQPTENISIINNRIELSTLNNIPLSISILDIKGNEIMNAVNTNNMDVSDLCAGFYFVVANYKEKSIIYKAIK